jgi:hypothetical protein
MTEKGWPGPIGPAAYHGPIGEYARRIAPESEGDPAAILVQTLVCFGNAAGRNPYFLVEDTPHRPNLNAVIVGDTSLARKGTSLERAFRAIAAADPGWGDRNNSDGGLSSAEGLINAVRDDPEDGPPDKRLMAMMGEFGETLNKMSREGNVLGATLRNAWDGKTLQVRTRHNPLRATDAHVSVIGHITHAELHDVLGVANVMNGFANRFLWVMAKRARNLPFGGKARIGDMPELVNAFQRALLWAHDKPRQIEFDAAARERWPKLYDQLAWTDADGLGPVLDRGPAQVRRLALVYAVADRSTRVTTKHVRAALEIWRYSHESVEYLFSDVPGDAVEAVIRRVLGRRKVEEWTARSDFTVAASKAEIATYRLGAALEKFTSDGMLESRVVPTRGRPKTEYRQKQR